MEVDLTKETGDQSRECFVLVADDDPAARTIVCESLRQNGYVVAESENGQQALDLFKEQKPDIVILDIMMPGMDGFEVCASLRKINGGEHTGVMMLTGLDDIESINRAFEAGASDFITKPINCMLLVQRVRCMWRAICAREELQKSEEKNRALIHAMPDLLFQINPSGIIQDFRAPKGFDMSAFPEDLVGKSMSDVFAIEDPHKAVKQSLQTGEMQVFEHRVQQNTVKYSYECRIVKSGEDQSLAIVRDITGRKQAEEKIIKLAYRDPLTGLLNRHSFKVLLTRAMEQAKRHNRLMAVMFLDLDRFKRINDSLGHNAGDVLLQRVGERITETLRRSDSAARFSTAPSNMVSRLGGDEFTILLSEIAQVHDAATVARRVLDSLSRPFTLGKHEVFVTASLGVTIYPHNGQDVDTLLKHADTAMYNAKDQGRNNFQLYSEPMGSASFRRLDLETKLRKALDRQELMLYYQPQVDIRSGEILGTEALIRWERPDMGIISPAEFIPVAEEIGLIGTIGEWVLLSACKQNKAWQEMGYANLRVAVNLSNLQFRQRDIFSDVTKALESSGLDPYFLELELTESAIMQNIEASLASLLDFKAMGVKIAIDDFGTGYSSLNYLKRFPLDALKIDRSFIKDIIFNQDDAAIAKAIIAMAQSLNLRVIAEGIETKEQLQFLSSQQCNEAQGYLFSRPLPTKEITKFLSTHGTNWRERTIFLW